MGDLENVSELQRAWNNKLGCRKLTPDFRMTDVLTILPSRLGGLEMGTD